MRLAIMVLALCAMTTPAGAIVIRHDVTDAAYHATESDIPAVFALLRTRRGFWDCPATLIAPHWAISAAHCAETPRISEGVAGGGFDVAIAGAANRIDAVVAHPEAPEADLALLHLRDAVTHAAPMPLYDDDDEMGKVVILLGWGDTGDGIRGVTGSDGQFRRAENVVDQAEGPTLSWLFDAPDVALAHEGISGPGDSGGPALIATAHGFALAGISSGQDPMGHTDAANMACANIMRASRLRATGSSKQSPVSEPYSAACAAAV